MTGLPATIRAARKAAGLTQVDLAAAAEISQTYLSDLERGVTVPSLPVLERLAKALGKRLEVALVEDEA